ncbi:glycosyltransferase [Flavitalea sp. BT771]|uniref:glycosyltransferase n=1 Tax=Flavitalea sp. BT771 TaxID=3063329 RepID=UPI0026E3F703|nr:glycosyltransferase [Flavitalea sp. BT771]MDO6434790.1 glycosyltransferase [Flavitalea sp. BT771]MDV6223690.1 glycosyltransferase [Flavitalea sp. BT771]
MIAKIAFIMTQPDAYSQTFVHAQRRYLTGEITTLWDMGRWSEEGPIQTQDCPNFDEALARFFVRKQINVVLAQFGLSGANVVGACRQLAIPLVVYFHGYDAYTKSILRNHAVQYQQLFDYGSSLIVVSQDMKEQLISLGAPAEKIVYVRSGVNDIFFERYPPLDSKTFVAVGRFVAKKAPHLTLYAFREVLKRHPEVRLIMIGAGQPLVDVCIDLVIAWGMKDSVEFMGVLDQSQIMEVFKRSFCFLQHSVTTFLEGDSEGTPLSVLEASAAGLPVISTKHKGIKEAVLDGETGLLVDERDVDGMIDCMCRLLADGEKARQMGDIGRQHIRKNYSMEEYISGLNRIIAMALTR